MNKRNNKKLILISLLTFVCLCIFEIDFYKTHIVSTTSSLVAYKNAIDEADAESGVQMKNRDVYQQNFRGVRNEFLGFSIKFDTFAKNPKGKMLIELLNGEDLSLHQAWEIELETLENWTDYDFIFEKPILDAQDKRYIIRVTLLDADEGTLISVVQSRSDSYAEGELFFNGENTGKDMCFKLKGTTGFLRSIYLGLFMLIGIGYWLLIWGIYVKKWGIHRIFLVLGFVFGMNYLILFPPCTTPDEYSHLATAYSDANIFLFEEEQNEEGKVLVRTEDTYIKDLRVVNRTVFNDMYNTIHKETIDETKVPLFRGRLNVPVTAHAPQAIGIMIGWLFHLNAVYTVYLGKIFGLLFYLFVCFFAIKIIPWGKTTLFIIALLPMSLELAVSYSYDMVINSTVFLFIAYSLYLQYEKEKVEWKDIIFLTICAAIFVPIKVSYVFLCVVVFFIPKNKFKKTSRYYLGTILTCVSGIIIFVSMRLQWFMSFFAPVNESSGFVPSEPGFTIGQILSEPIESIRLFLSSLYFQGDYYLRSTMGTILSWGDMQLPVVIFTIFFVLVLLSLFTYESDKKKYFMGKVQKTVCYGACFVMIGGIFLVLWLSTTPINAKYIMGVQGRYFLTFLPIVLLALKNEKLVLKKNIDNGLILGMFMVQVYTLYVIWRYVVA